MGNNFYHLPFNYLWIIRGAVAHVCPTTTASSCTLTVSRYCTANWLLVGCGTVAGRLIADVQITESSRQINERPFGYANVIYSAWRGLNLGFNK